MRSILTLLLTQAALAGSPAAESEWAADWSDAARRAREEKKLVLVLVELYSGLKIPDRLPALFEDGVLADLKRHRFVGLRWKRGMKAPFQDPSVYGMGDFTFGAAVLVATSDGSIAAQMPPHSTWFLDQRLRAVLQQNAAFTGDAIGEFSDPLDLADLLLKRGDLDKAEALLRSDTSLRGLRLRATLLLRLRRGTEALAVLRKARELAGPDSAAEVMVDEGIALIGMGRTRDASETLRAVLQQDTGRPRHAEASFWLSHLLLRESPAEGRAGFERTARMSPESRWGRAAAAILSPEGLESAAAMRLGWPEDRALEVVRDLQSSPLPLADAVQGREGAIRLLCRFQSAEGSWQTPHGLLSEAPAFSLATTAICARSLLPFRGRKEVGEAVRRALDYTLAARASGALDRQGRSFGFGYSAWARIFAIRLFADCLRGSVGDHARLAEALKGYVKELERDQTASGGWTYYAGIEPTVITAAAIVAFLEAKEAGAAVSETAIRRGLANLSTARTAPGKFRYAPGGADPRAESGLRGPLCELALRRGGSGGTGAVQAALDHYLSCRSDVRKERGKALCHTGPDGTAAYYLLFGAAFSAEALSDLSADRREIFRKALIEDVLAARLEDGGFLDAPTMGRWYGTGMALCTLGRLLP